jgi:hypothetical protein
MAGSGSDDPTRWFDELYVAAEAGEAVVPWDRGSPRLLLVQWAEEERLEGRGRRAGRRSAVAARSGRGRVVRD